MTTKDYRRILLAKERELAAKIEREHEEARGLTDDSVGDLGDASVSDEEKETQFAGADADRIVLKQVRDALKRIDQGTFGRCSVDGGPIAEKRLEVVPWTPYCLKHQQEVEALKPRKTPTL